MSADQRTPAGDQRRERACVDCGREDCPGAPMYKGICPRAQRPPMRAIKLGDILTKPLNCEAIGAIRGKFGDDNFTVLELPKWTGSEWGCHNIRCSYLRHADTGRQVAEAYMPGPVEHKPEPKDPPKRWHIQEALSALDAFVDAYPAVDTFSVSYEYGRHRVSISVRSTDTSCVHQVTETTGEKP